jgi:cell wall assembly regulator SMI1
MAPGANEGRAMKQIWNRIEAWFTANVDPAYNPGAFLGGATDLQIQSLEKKLKLRLPDDVRESYLIHNGMEPVSVFYESQTLNSIEEILRYWEIMCGIERAGARFRLIPSPVGPIKSVWGNKKWVPITDSSGGHILCIDMDPAEGGKVGQVLDFCHETGPLRVVAASFREFLSQYADDLEANTSSLKVAVFSKSKKIEREFTEYQSLCMGM